MKKIIAFLFTVLVFTGCSNDSDGNKRNPVVGTWKLVKTETLSQIDNTTNSEDVSNQNITYTFDRSSNLTINTNGKIERFKYEYKLDYLGGGMPGDPKYPMVIINDSKWTYLMIDGKMVLGKSYVDGSDLFFEKK